MLGMWWHSLNTTGRQKIASYQTEGRMWWYDRKWVISAGWSGGGIMERHVGYKEDDPGEGGKS